jgi:Flp pilus assembly protein TadG
MRFAVVRLLAEMRSMLACQRGQVMLIFAFAATMLIIAVGMGIDLWQAYVVKARLQSAVDAAALAIASTDRTQYTTAELQARVQSYVTANYPASTLGTPGTPTMGPTLACDGGAVINIVNVCDTATVPTTFMRIVGIDTLSVSTVGQAKAAWPFIDFYLLLDSSPSMAIAATQAGINTMVANTQQQCDSPPNGGPTCGCGFACHETHPNLDTHCGTVVQGCGLAGLANKNPANVVDNTIDNYKLSQNLGVKLRIDNLRTAAADLMTTAQTTETTNGIANEYRMAIYTFDVRFNNGVAPAGPVIQSLTSDLATAATNASNIQLLTMYNNNHLVSGDSNNDADSNFTSALTGINAIMPAPGQGTTSPGDTPKEVLFFVTDGLEDQAVGSCSPVAGSVTCSNGNKRRYSPIDPTLCTTIKNRGILIAVLYTEYLPLPTNGWYNTYVKPFQPQPSPPGVDQIAVALQSCASPGLYTEVLTGGDISGALKQLFILAVNAVFLSH